MKSIRVETPLSAPAGLVWDVLTDFPRYGEWNPLITSIEGELRPGARLHVTLELPGRKPRTLTPTVAALEPARRLRWLGRLWVPGLFDGEHSLEIEQDDGAVLFVHREDFRGVLVPMVGKVLSETRAGFAAMNDALVQRVASLSEGTPQDK